MTAALTVGSPSTKRALRVLWIEVGQASSASGLVWLRRRMQHFEFARRTVAVIDHPWPAADGSVELHDLSICRSSATRHDLRRLTERIDCGVERIVVACVNRLDYPVELIDFLQQTCAEVPLAVAGDSWWDGRRRTGLPTPGHLSLAWYRWWDGWVDWLQGSSPTLFEVAPAAWPRLTCQATAAAIRKTTVAGCSVAASSTAAASKHGLIAGNCRQTTAAWALAASAAGHTSECISWQQFQQQFLTRWSHTPLQWVLWDDTCLDTFPGQSNPLVASRQSVAADGFASLRDSDQADRHYLEHPTHQGAGRVAEQGAEQVAGQVAERAASGPADEAAIRTFFESLAGAAQNVSSPRMSSPQQALNAAHPEQISNTSHGADGVLGIVAVSMPRAGWAIGQCASPGRELLVKPSGGGGLARLLS